MSSTTALHRRFILLYWAFGAKILLTQENIWGYYNQDKEDSLHSHSGMLTEMYEERDCGGNLVIALLRQKVEQ